jgi:hypothetical protein
MALTEDEMARLIDAHDVEAIAALPAYEIDGFVIGLVRRLAGEPVEPDGDRLISLGFQLQLAGWARTDRTLVAELDRRPTERVLDVVCLLLIGLWNRGADPAALRTLTEIERRLQPSDPAAVHSFQGAVTVAGRSTAP